MVSIQNIILLSNYLHSKIFSFKIDLLEIRTLRALGEIGTGIDVVKWLQILVSLTV